MQEAIYTAANNVKIETTEKLIKAMSEVCNILARNPY